HGRGSSIKCNATLSLDPFSRKALPQTLLADRRTHQLLRQGSGGNADRPQRAIAAFNSDTRPSYFHGARRLPAAAGELRGAIRWRSCKNGRSINRKRIVAAA